MPGGNDVTVASDSSLLSQVHVKVSVPKGIKFVGHPGRHHLTRKKCVAPGEATPTSIVLSFTELGSANITGTNTDSFHHEFLDTFIYSYIIHFKYYIVWVEVQIVNNNTIHICHLLQH